MNEYENEKKVYLNKPFYHRIIVYDDKFYLQINSRNKPIPLPFKRINENNILTEFFKKYFIFRSKNDKNPFLEEFANYDWSKIVIPLTIDEIFSKHNWNNLFRTK